MAKSIRVSDGIYELAAATGAALNRSLADQVEYWARLGAALDAAGVTLEQTLGILGEATLKEQVIAQATRARNTSKRRRYAGDAGIAARQARFDREVATGERSPDSLLLMSRERVLAATFTFAPEAHSDAAEW